MPADKGVYNARWEKSFDRILTPLEEFIQRQTTSSILLMICMVIALVIANSPLARAVREFPAYADRFQRGQRSVFPVAAPLDQ